jgi:integrase
MRRPKTKFPRAATLWPETVEALKSLRRGPVYVFTSPHGTKFQSSNSRCNEFAKLRTRAAVPDTVSFAQLKDGAFTVACQKTTGDGRIAKILAGHASGMEDAYVLRNPEIVKPACDAVYAHYGPFPT